MQRSRTTGTPADRFSFFAHDYEHDWGGVAYADAYGEAMRGGLTHIEAKRAARQAANEAATAAADAVSATVGDEIFRLSVARMRISPPEVDLPNEIG